MIQPENIMEDLIPFADIASQLNTCKVTVARRAKACGFKVYIFSNVRYLHNSVMRDPRFNRPGRGPSPN